MTANDCGSSRIMSGDYFSCCCCRPLQSARRPAAVYHRGRLCIWPLTDLAKSRCNLTPKEFVETTRNIFLKKKKKSLKICGIIILNEHCVSVIQTPDKLIKVLDWNYWDVISALDLYLDSASTLTVFKPQQGSFVDSSSCNILWEAMSVYAAPLLCNVTVENVFYWKDIRH